MDIAVVTGASKGLGEQITRNLLAKGVGVIAISRQGNEDIRQFASECGSFYQFVPADLTNIETIETIEKRILTVLDEQSVKHMYVINNAAMLEPVGYAHQLDPKDIEKHFALNVFAPMELLHVVLRLVTKQSIPVVAGNITSGAATSAIPGWSTYSSAKAAINAYTRTIAVEQESLGKAHAFFAFSPGVMDTNMQTEIRATDEANFPDVERFRHYKESGRLVDPAIVAEVFVAILLGEKGPIQSGHVYQVADYL